MDVTSVSVIQFAATATLVAILAHVMVGLGASLRRRARSNERHARALALLDHRIEAARHHRIASEQESLSWQGFRKFEVARKVDEGGQVCSFYLKTHDGRPLPGFRPGQYLTFRVRIPGQPTPTTRCYSLSSIEHAEHYRCSIKRVDPPPERPDLPPGKASGYFHEQLQEQDIVDVKAPAGAFFLDTAKTTPVVLIGGGIGLTPVLCMLEAIAQQGFNRDVHFFYGVRNSSDHVMKSALEDLDTMHSRLHLHVCYSQPAEGDVQGADFRHAGRVTVDLLRQELPSSNFEFYICGPAAMMESLVHELVEWGVPAAAVHFEAFGPATVKQTSTPAVADGGAELGFDVEFRRSGKTARWSASAGSLLECAEASGIDIPAGCRAGNCGTCVTTVREGNVRYLHPPGDDPEAGTCLVCVGVPASDLVLDV